jgi:hypothetical protein
VEDAAALARQVSVNLTVILLLALLPVAVVIGAALGQLRPREDEFEVAAVGFVVVRE